MATTVSLATTDGDMALYDAAPEGAPLGAVIVLQEAFGVNDHIEDVTGRLAQSGYRAVAPHLFHRSGDEALEYGNFEKIVPHMQALTAAGLVEDLDVTLAHLTAAGFAAPSVGVVGFCMGGSVVFLAATRRALGAAVTFYGGGVVEGRFGMSPMVESAPGLKTPWLGLFGDQDQGIPVDQVEALRAATATATVPTEIVRYPEAGHGFHCDARPDSYHQPSAEDGWRRTLDWFGRYLAKP